MVVAQARGPGITADGPWEYGLFVLGIVGVMSAAIEADRANHKREGWMKRCEIDDPVDQIRETLADSLAETMSLVVLESDRRTRAVTPEGVIKDYPGADLILDIRTSKWGIHSPKTESTRRKIHYVAGYEGSFRLIDARKSAVVAEATCKIQFSNRGDPPTIKELLEDDCALLDEGLTLSAQTCAKHYRTRALGLE